MKSLLTASLALLIATFGALGHADPSYPNRPIKIVVGFAPGGTADAIARAMAAHMSLTLKQQVIVENRPGANTTLAPTFVAGAAPDGYTLLLALDSNFGADKVLWRPNVKYDETSFTPITRLASLPFILAVNNEFGVKRVSELVTKVNQNNNKVFVAVVPAIYTSMIISRFNQMTGITMVPVPYKGGGPAVMAVVANDVPMTFSGATSVMPMVKSGRLNALAITSAKRSPLIPDVPTLDEEGLAGFNVSFWYGLAGPAGMPEDVVNKLFDASRQAFDGPGLRATLATAGLEPDPSQSVAEFRATVARDGRTLTEAAKTLGNTGQ